MASIVGGIGTTHVPAIGNAIAKGQQREPYWKPFFEGFDGAHRWLAKVQPDVAVVIYNDHGLNFFLDKLPTFAVGAASEYKHADEGWGLPVSRPYPGDPALSWHLIESLVADEFDVTICQEMLVDHAFTIPSPCCGRCPTAGRCAPCRSQSTPCNTPCLRRPGASSSAKPSAAPSSRSIRMRRWS